jgi:glucose/arabinose dehydrogenase
MGCSKTTPPTPAPGTDIGQTVTGRERFGWDQPASDAAELATFRYAIYVDGVRSVVADVSCGAAAGGFACSGRLPAMTPGTHTLELAAYFDTDEFLESGKSPPLRVTVTGLTTQAIADPLQSGEIITSVDGVRLAAALVADGLSDVVDFAITPDGRIVVAERAGRVRVVEGASLEEAAGNGTGISAADGAILGLTLDPDFPRTGHVFVIHAPPGAFRIVRYRLAGGALVERMALIRDVPAAAEPSATLRAGPDGKLYAAFDDGGSPDAAARLSEWSGKILRMNMDGSTPDDQPAASPVFWSGLRSPRGLGWTPDGATLWMAEQSTDGVDRIGALVTAPERPRRASQRVSYTLPPSLGPRSLVLHRGGDIREFRGDMFVAAAEAEYLLRVRFNPSEPLRALSTEKMLEGRLGPLRAVAISADGSIYVASDSALWRLARVR